MQLPKELQLKIEEKFEKAPLKTLATARESLTSDYQKGSSSPFDDEGKRLAYLGARMPATYAACAKVLSQTNLYGHILDLGAGPGTASWAAFELFPDIDRVTLIERSADAIQLGKELAEGHPMLRRADWKRQSLDAPLPKADVAILSYVLNELRDVRPLLVSCLKAAPLIVIVEPGTPKGFSDILKYREDLLNLGAEIHAPCPHAYQCPIQKNDWCHFSVRVERSRIHRLLKTGTLGYEDEKFCYLIVSQAKKASKLRRVIRRPLKKSGHVLLTLCSHEGKIEETCFSKKEKVDYRKAKKSDWGDLI